MRIKRTAKVLSAYEFMQKFPTEKKALRFFEKERWPNGVICPTCKSKKITKRPFPYYRCRDCRDIFTVRTKTIFHRSKIKFQKWLYASYLLQTARKGVSSLQLSKQIGVTQKTAWFMLHRLREACKSGGGLLSGDVQVNETYFGGLSKNKHKSKLKKEKSWKDSKAMVQGMRAGNKVKTKVIKQASKAELQGNIIDNIEAGSKVMTDEAMHYHTLDSRFIHLTTHHATNQYVNEETGATTNAIESVWALMKRGHKGVYHHFSKKHLHRYLEEFNFRLDKGNCAIDTIDRVRSLVKGATDKRLTYETLTK